MLYGSIGKDRFTAILNGKKLAQYFIEVAQATKTEVLVFTKGLINE
jgi:hypothetical protein